MKQHAIIGTAGHIDHGKTALIKALTGIDADRLKEEKERGITIDIGFAYWRDDVTIIDVPGHEKFIRNMVAGVSTIDFFLLVIAADDGIMPQTIEHLDILTFFNITAGLVVINKIDLVDREWLDLVTEEIKEMLTGYNLSHIPVLPCSAHTGENLPQVKQMVEETISSLTEQTSSHPFRLLIDRSFSIKGHGTVVTGTVLSGSLKKGDEVLLMPRQRQVKVRGIQTHTTDVNQVFPGFRAAVNLQGINKAEVIRGDVICARDTMIPATEFTGIMKTVSKISLNRIANRSRVHVYAGTAECSGQLIWYDNEKYLKEGMTYHVRVKLDQPISAARNDAFLIRLHSPVITLAGGRILEINSRKIKHEQAVWQEYYKNIDTDDLSVLIAFLIHENGLKPLSGSDLQKKLFEDIGLIEAVLDDLKKKKQLRTVSRASQEYHLSEITFDSLLSEITAYLDSYHEEMPHIPGINQKELVDGIGKGWLMPELIEAALRKLINSKLIRIDKNLIARSEFKVRMSRDTDEIIELLLAQLLASPFAPPTAAELSLKL